MKDIGRKNDNMVKTTKAKRMKVNERNEVSKRKNHLKSDSQ